MQKRIVIFGRFSVYFLLFFVFFFQKASAEGEDSLQQAQPPEGSYSAELRQRIDKYGLSGNWIKKLAWLKEAVEYDAQISSLHQEILSLRGDTYQPKIEKIKQSLLSSRNASKGSSRGLDESILQLQNDIDEKLNRLLDTARKADQAKLQQDARYKLYEAEGKITEYKSQLSNLKMEIGVIDSLQKAFSDRVAKLDEYINKSGEIAGSSEEKIKEIFDLFDDEKAKEATFYVKGLLEQMKKVHKYVKTDALQSFDAEQVSLSKAIEELNSKTNQIREGFSKVSAEIVSIEKIVDGMVVSFESDGSGDSSDGQVVSAAPKPAKRSDKPGFLSRAFNFISIFFNMILGLLGLY